MIVRRSRGRSFSKAVNVALGLAVNTIENREQQKKRFVCR